MIPAELIWEQTQCATQDEAKLLVGKRVVIVEDEGMTQMQLQSIIRKAGLVLAGTAANGKTGVETVLREKPDLVLMDIKMPEMNGLEAAVEILSSLRVCIVILTAYSEETIQNQAHVLGICGYVVKPTSRDLLLPHLAAALQRFERPLSD